MKLDGFPLKREDRYGAYLWWPEDGNDWIHPYDVPIAMDNIPGNLVFRRSDLDQDYSLIAHGSLKIRVRPTLWYPIEFEGFNVGDFVEVCSHCGKNQPLVASIIFMRWNKNSKRIEYSLEKSGRQIPQSFHASDLQHADRLNRIPVKPSQKLVIEPPKEQPMQTPSKPSTFIAD